MSFRAKSLVDSRYSFREHISSDLGMAGSCAPASNIHVSASDGRTWDSSAVSDSKAMAVALLQSICVPVLSVRTVVCGGGDSSKGGWAVGVAIADAFFFGGDGSA